MQGLSNDQDMEAKPRSSIRVRKTASSRRSRFDTLLPPLRRFEALSEKAMYSRHLFRVGTLDLTPHVASTLEHSSGEDAARMCDCIQGLFQLMFSKRIASAE